LNRAAKKRFAIAPVTDLPGSHNSTDRKGEKAKASYEHQRRFGENWANEHFVSPHPGPLPIGWGEGEALEDRIRTTKLLAVLCRQRKDLRN
jgi:hypothetical protein